MKRVIVTTALIAFIAAINTGCFVTSVPTTPVEVTVYTVIPVAPPPIVVTTGPGYVVQPGPRYVWIEATGHGIIIEAPIHGSMVIGQKCLIPMPFGYPDIGNTDRQAMYG